MPEPPTTERRRHYRIPSIVPVDFQLLDKTHAAIDPEIRTGFTQDLSEAGTCVSVSSLPFILDHQFDEPGNYPDIAVDLPLPRRPLRVLGKIVWTQVTDEIKRSRLMGVEFYSLTHAHAEEVTGFARRAARRPKIMRGLVAAGLFLALLVAAGAWWSRAHYKEEAKRAQQALANSENQYDSASKELERLWMELRWLAIEVGELADEAGDEPTAVATAEMEQSLEPAVQDLNTSIARLRKIVEDRSSQSAEAKPPEPGTGESAEAKPPEPGTGDSAELPP